MQERIAQAHHARRPTGPGATTGTTRETPHCSPAQPPGRRSRAWALWPGGATPTGTHVPRPGYDARAARDHVWWLFLTEDDILTTTTLAFDTARPLDRPCPRRPVAGGPGSHALAYDPIPSSDIRRRQHLRGVAG